MKIVSSVKFLLKSLFGERATGVFAVVGVLFLVLALSLSDVNIAVKYKLLEDSLIAAQSFILFLSAIFYAFLLMEKERKGGIFVFIIASGGSRSEYFGALFLTIFTLLSAVFAVFLTIDIAFLSVFADGVNIAFLSRITMSALSSALLGFLTLGLSRFVSNTNAVIYAIFLFFIGNGADELMLYALSEKGAVLSIVANTIYYVFPNFSFFDTASLQSAFDKQLFALLYFVAYSLILYALAHFKLKKEVLRVG
jgi:hypothetical protein